MFTGNLLFALPVSVWIFFLVHWFSIRDIPESKDRLPICRIVYLGLSLQILVYSWFLGIGIGWEFLWVLLAVFFSFVGDIFNLHFPWIQKRMEHPLLGGIFSFFLAQGFYVLSIFRILSWEELFPDSLHYAILVGFLFIPAAIFFFRVYNPRRPKSVMFSAFFYGFLLCFVVTLLINGSLVKGGDWWILATGGIFFLISDAVMGETTIHGERHPAFEFQVPWFTYLIASGLLLVGFYRLYQS